MRDDVQFSQPESFESALITWGTVHRIGDHELEIKDGDDAVRVVVDTQGRAFELKQQTINEDVDTKRKPVHVGLVLTEKISTATITLRISPAVK